MYFIIFLLPKNIDKVYLHYRHARITSLSQDNQSIESSENFHKQEKPTGRLRVAVRSALPCSLRIPPFADLRQNVLTTQTACLRIYLRQLVRL